MIKTIAAILLAFSSLLAQSKIVLAATDSQESALTGKDLADEIIKTVLEHSEKIWGRKLSKPIRLNYKVNHLTDQTPEQTLDSALLKEMPVAASGDTSH